MSAGSGCSAGSSRPTRTPAGCCRRGRSGPTAPTSPGSRRGPRRSRRPSSGPGLLGTVTSAAEVTGSLAKTFAEGVTGLGGGDRAVPFRAPKTIFNGRIHTPRRFATQHYPIERLKKVAAAADASLNDVFLTICGGALRRYLSELDALPRETLTANVPVSVRQGEEAGVGNAITFLYSSMGTDIEDPVERIEAIRASTQLGKARLPKASGVTMDLYTAALMAPFLGQAILGVGGHGRPVFNLVVSNVPGPTERRYIDGSPLEEIYPVSLLFNGQALNITAVSYDGEFNIGYTGCRDSLPSLQKIAVYSGEELDRLEAGLPPECLPRPARPQVHNGVMLEGSRPQVVAHRGSSDRQAEHTLGAYVAALDEGAQAFECDVRLTADGHLVCVHDRNLRRTAHRDAVVSAMELADLEDLDFTSWKNPWADLDDELPDSDPDLGKVLTLRRLLETVADYPRRVELAIETKHPTRYAGLVERRLVQLLDEFGWAGQDSPARVMSFSWVALRRVRRLAPDLELVMLVDNRSQWYRSRPFIDNDWIAGPGIEMVREHPDALLKMRDGGRRVHCWVVNSEEDIDRCLELGIEAIITDKPGAAVTYLSLRET